MLVVVLPVRRGLAVAVAAVAVAARLVAEAHVVDMAQVEMYICL